MLRRPQPVFSEHHERIKKKQTQGQSQGFARQKKRQKNYREKEKVHELEEMLSKNSWAPKWEVNREKSTLVLILYRFTGYCEC